MVDSPFTDEEEERIRELVHDAIRQELEWREQRERSRLRYGGRRRVR